MNGIQELDNKLNKKIDGFIKANSSRPYLQSFRYHIMNDMSLTSVYQYLTYVNNFMNFNGKNPEELTLVDYDMFLASISDKSKSYRITTYSALKRFSSYLAASTINTLDPMQYVKRPKKTKADESIESIEKRNKGFLDVEEISQLKDNIVELPGRMRNTLVDRDTAIVTVFLSTGMRCSALCKLDLSNINANDHTLIVKDKGGKIKVHYLSNKAWEALEKWLNKREAPEDQPALFISSKGGRLTYSGVKKMIDKYTQNIKGKHITPHKLRATYATQLYNETKDIYFVQKCMDHFSPDTTQLYIRGNNDNSKKAAEIMNNLL